MSATLTVLAPGLHTLVVDRGRPRSRALGVPVGGAADRFALALGNGLVGNAADAAALEATLAGPTLVSDADVACVLFGAPFVVNTDRRTLEAGTTFTLAAGEVLIIGHAARGARAYLCVRGGLDPPLILASRTGLAPLTAGDRVACRPGRIPPRRIAVELPGPAPLRALPGPQADWFPPFALAGATFRVSPASNRMGLRLHGPALVVPPREMVSEPVCPGTVQVTRDGQCIVLGADGQTIGGYPRVAQVITADLDRLGQLRPGELISFDYVTLDEAEALAAQRAATLRGWLARLAATCGG